ncbi:metallophosphoesterase, partial [Streptomyces sp. NPDC047970]
MVAVAVLVIILVVAVFAGAHWYVWRRLVRDTTAPRSTVRRLGTAAIWVLPVLTVGAFTAGRVDAPFWLEQVLAWPGYLWLPVLLYVILALLVGEAVRPLLLRFLARRGRGASVPAAEAAAPAEAAVGRAAERGAA